MDINAARQFLADLPGITWFKPIGELGPDYVQRLAGNIRRQLQAGRELDVKEARREARGHRYTPEHPGRKARVRSRPVERGGTAIGERMTKAGLLRPVVNRPHRHPGRDTLRSEMVPWGGGAISYPAKTAAEALFYLHEAADAGSRVQFDIFDCSKQGNKWATIYHNPGSRRSGITATALFEKLKATGYTLEEQLLSDVGTGISDEIVVGRYSHICFYHVHIFPERF